MASASQFVCPDCSVAFTRNSALTKHRLKMCTDKVARFSCSDCPFRAGSQSLFLIHVTQEHQFVEDTETHVFDNENGMSIIYYLD